MDRHCCDNCWWNFGGVCASHSTGTYDTYGSECDTLVLLYPYGCSEYRKEPDILKDQDE